MSRAEGSVGPDARVPWIWEFCFSKLCWYPLAALPVSTPMMDVECLQLSLHKRAKMEFKKKQT